MTIDYEQYRNYVRIARDVAASDPEDEAALLPEAVRPLVELIDKQTAAIARVRRLCATRYELGHGSSRLVGVEDVLAALDGES